MSKLLMYWTVCNNSCNFVQVQVLVLVQVQVQVKMQVEVQVLVQVQEIMVSLPHPVLGALSQRTISSLLCLVGASYMY